MFAGLRCVRSFVCETAVHACVCVCVCVQVTALRGEQFRAMYEEGWIGILPSDRRWARAAGVVRA